LPPTNVPVCSPKAKTIPDSAIPAHPADSGQSTHECWRGLWQETADMLGDRMHARWICEVASSTTSDEFLTILNDAPTVRMVSHLDAMVARYQTGEPVQYVLGRWGFRRLDLAIDARVLIPRPETELVAEVALQLAAALSPHRTVVDLGTGSGAIGLALADELPVEGTTVWLTDSSSDALDVARANLAGIGRAAQNVRIGLGSWFEGLPADLQADVIVSNPPYVAEGSVALEAIVGDWEPASALFAGAAGLDDIRVIVDGALRRLHPGGALVLEIGGDQGAAVSALLAGAGYVDVEIRPDLAGNDRIAIAHRK
jgi:release factor glutamine methyltransferase